MRIGMVAVLIVGAVHSLSSRTSTLSFGEMNDFVRNTFALPTNDPGTRTFIAYYLQAIFTQSSLSWVGGGIAGWENFGIVLRRFRLISICTWMTML